FGTCGCAQPGARPSCLAGCLGRTLSNSRRAAAASSGRGGRMPCPGRDRAAGVRPRPAGAGLANPGKPIGAIVMGQAILNIRDAARFANIAPEAFAYLRGEHGMPPGPMDAILRARAAQSRAASAAAQPLGSASNAEQRLLSHWFPDRDVTHLYSVPR